MKRYLIYIMIVLLAFSGIFLLTSFAEENKWTRKADMPTARAWPAICTVNGKIYAIGGSTDGDNAISTVEEYDPVTDKWTKKADMPTARKRFSACAMGGKIYATGGWDAAVLSAMEEYDPVKDKWTEKVKMPTCKIRKVVLPRIS